MTEDASNPAPPSPEEVLARLRREREEAARSYNDALTALDRAIQRLSEMPPLPPPYDEHQLAALNERWDLSLKPPERGGWLGRLRAHVWTVVAPPMERQQAFNSALVDHLNRNAATHRETVHAMASMLAMFRAELERLVHFQSKLVVYAQQITPFIDTRDRETAEWTTEHLIGLERRLQQRTTVIGTDLGVMRHDLNVSFNDVRGEMQTGLSAVSDELLKRWESMVAREGRFEAHVSDMRSAIGVLQRATQSFKRALEARQDPAAPAAVRQDHPTPASRPVTSSLDSYKYVAFEDEFRGSERDIRARVEAYLPFFEGASDVLDIGCGRGEFLDLLRQHGISGRGVDLNDEMAAVCRDRGLEATAGDALSYLLAQPDASLGGIFAAQVVEHLEPDYLVRLLEAAYHKLRPGSRIILETINPACWFAFFSSYIRDITHVQPLHPDTLQYLLRASSFQQVQIRYSAPFPEEEKLQTVDLPRSSAETVEDVSDERLSRTSAVFNDNVQKLNALLFTYLDYAAIGERL